MKIINENLFRIIFILFLPFAAACLINQKYINPAIVMVTSLSSDGHYAITSDMGKRIILWNLENKSKKYISWNANIYSAYFIKNTDDFMWQGLNNIVHVETINGKQLLKFKNFTTYGEVMTSDLKHYFSSNDNWNLYSGYGGTQHLIFSDGEQGGFSGAQKLFNLTLSNDNQILLSSGIGSDADFLKKVLKEMKERGYLYEADGINLWQVDSSKLLYAFSSQVGKAFATISPDGQYIVGGDESSCGYVWNAKTGRKVFDLDDLEFGRVVNKNVEPWQWDNTGLIKQPPDYNKYASTADSILTLKFIDNDHYLRVTTYAPYAILYEVKNPLPLKYIRLGKNPMPSVSDYSRDESIDTSPSAHILVTGQNNHSGIIVYRYNPKTQTLTKIWAPQA